MATVLELVQRACYEMNVQAPSSLYGNTGQSERQLLHLLYAEARYLRNERIWIQQKKSYSFDLEANRSKYPLPRDYYAPLLDTHWDRDAKIRLNGPKSDSQFGVRLYGAGSSNRTAYRIFGPDNGLYTAGGQLMVDPTPTAAGQTLGFEYATSNLFIPKYWVISTVYASGTYVSANGNIYLCDTNGTSSSTTAPSAVTQNITDGTTRWDYQAEPYEVILADTDLCLFDDDIVIAGIKWRFKAAGDFEHAELKQEHDNMVTRAKSRYMGSFIGRFDQEDSGPRYRPNTDGGWDL